MRSTIPYFVLAIVFFGTSCKRGVPPQEYVKYVENAGNGLKQKKEVNGVGYMLQYEPIPYCVMLEKRSFIIPEDIFKQEYKRFEGLGHYTFKIEKNAMDSLVNKLGDSSKYKKSIADYFGFQIQRDIKLVEGNDTIPCGICQMDAGRADSYTFSIGFPDKDGITEEQKDIRIVYGNKILKTGEVIFDLKARDVKNVPQLKMM